MTLTAEHEAALVSVRAKRLSQIRPNRDAIAPYLKAWDHNAPWRLECRDGKFTKVPYQASGQRAKSDTPDTWTDFETAWRLFENPGVPFPGSEVGNYQGVGIFLGDPTDLVVFDWDKRIEDGVMEPRVRQDLEELQCYAELSPSGKGVRGFLRCSAPQEFWDGLFKREGDFEMYRGGRFMTLTGALLIGSPEDVPEISPEALKIFHDRIFSRRVLERERQEAERIQRRAELEARRALTLDLPEGSWTFDEEGAWTTDTAQREYDGVIRHFISQTAQGKSRHDTLNKMAYLLGGMAATGAPLPDRALAELHAVALASMGSTRAKEVADTLQDGFRKGQYRPKYPSTHRQDRHACAAPAAPTALAPVALTPTAPATVPSRQESKAETSARFRLRNAYRSMVKSASTIPLFSDPVREKLKTLSECGEFGRKAVCETESSPGHQCKHNRSQMRSCKRQACPGCGVWQKRIMVSFLLEDYKLRDRRRAQLGMKLDAWWFEYDTGQDFNGMAAGKSAVLSKVPAKKRNLVKAYTRWVNAPGRGLVMVNNVAAYEALASVLGQGTNVSALVDLVPCIERALSRRGAREREALLSLRGVFEGAGYALPKTNEMPSPIPESIHQAVRDHEFFLWLNSRVKISTAGQNANDDAKNPEAPENAVALSWPDAEKMALQRKLQIEAENAEREKNNEALIKPAWHCQEHGCAHIGWYAFREGHETTPVRLARQPEYGKAPTWSSVEEALVAADPSPWADPGG